MKFVMTQAVCPEGMQLLDGIADVYVADNQDPNNYLDEMRDAAALIVRIAKCDANAIENSPKLKVIGRTGVGYDSVDVKKQQSLVSRWSSHREPTTEVLLTCGSNDFCIVKESYRGTERDVQRKLGNPWSKEGFRA